MKQQQKIAIVTGASKGIGAACARKLAASGYKVCVNYRESRKEAEALAKEIGGIAVQADMGVEADIIRLFETVDRELGPVTALVNNAAVSAVGPVEKLAWQELDTIFRVNVLGTFTACREALKRMKGGGAIVNLSSEAAKFGGNQMAAYAASKAAVSTFTLAFAREAAAKGVRVNAVSPGIIDTEANSGIPAEKLKSIPLGRMGKPEEVAETVVWLLSEQASYVSSAVLSVAGAR